MSLTVVSVRVVPLTVVSLTVVSLTVVLLTACIIIILKKVGSARLRESDMHPVSPKTSAPQYQPIDRKKRNGKRFEDYSWDRAAYANKKALALLLTSASLTPSNTRLAR